MKWGKIILFFQATVTLVIGVIFLTQLLVLEKVEIEELKYEIGKGHFFGEEGAPPIFQEIKTRYTIAGYSLLIISIIEIIIISRLIS